MPIILVKDLTQKVTLIRDKSKADMAKSVYDTNSSGKVDDAEKVNGKTVEENVPVGAKFTDTIPTVNDLGLERVDNTNDAEKPISTATQSALNDKVNEKTYLHKSANYTIDPADDDIRCTGSFDLTFHTAVGYEGKRIQLKNGGSGTVNLLPDGTETLKNESTQKLYAGESHEWISNNVNWEI